MDVFHVNFYVVLVKKYFYKILKIKLLNIFIILVNLLACGLLPAQSGIDKELLSQLEAELFPENPEWIPIKEYPGCNNYELIVDSTLMVRRIQPD